MPNCDVVQGKPWQFKEFPYKGADKGDMVETFSNIFGAFFHYKDEKVRMGWLVLCVAQVKRKREGSPRAQ